jgi:hypothetical protein
MRDLAQRQSSAFTTQDHVRLTKSAPFRLFKATGRRSEFASSLTRFSFKTASTGDDIAVKSSFIRIGQRDCRNLREPVDMDRLDGGENLAMRLLEFGFYCAALMLIGIRTFRLTLLNGWFSDPRCRAVTIGDDAVFNGVFYPM